MSGAQLAAILSALLLGLLTGAMLLISVALVPFWQALPPREFRSWFTANASRIGRLMVPLGGGSASTSILALLLGRGGPSAAWLAASAVAAVGVVLVTLLVNEPTNRIFLGPDRLDDDAIRARLGRWAFWHYARVALGLVGVSTALWALRQG
jgi:uncharacterized membrane protein